MSRQRPPGMSGSFEKSVKGGTKIKLAPPKAKYVEHILVATHAGEAGVAEIFRALQNRLRDSTWTIVFKALIIVHLMIREGEPNVTLKSIADTPSKLAISNFSDVQVQGTNIRHYYTYLLSRAKAYKDTRIDWVREGQSRLKRQTVDHGLLRETEAVQSQISKLLQCDLLSTEAENEITVCAFRLLTMDLLVLYGVMNEGTINVLEHYFEMPKFDAERALGIYKAFTKQTNMVVEFLGTARQYENATRLEIPKLKHAPTSLTSSLEEYLSDPDFEVNRRQYLVQQQAKKTGKKIVSNGVTEPSNDFAKQPANRGGTNKDFPEPKVAPAATEKSEPKGPALDLIDFFDSIEQNQQPMASAPSQQQVPNFGVGPHQQQQQMLQQTGALPQPPTFFIPNGQQLQQQDGRFGSGNPFVQSQVQEPAQQDFTAAGFGGFGQQPLPQPQDIFANTQQSNAPQFPQPQQTYGTGSQSFPIPQQPFNTGQQPMNTGQQSFGTPQRSLTLGSQPMNTGHQPQSSNPFRQTMMAQSTGSSVPSYSNTQSVSSPTSYQSTNPFARNPTGQQTSPMQNSPFSSQSQTQGTSFTPPLAQQQQQQNTPFTSPPPPIPQQSQPQPVQLQRTGTNPFARNVSTPQHQQPATSPLTATPTGSTNPFRQSTFVNQQTGQGWQANQGTMGGFEQLDTVPIFPRPGQPQQQQQGAWP